MLGVALDGRGEPQHVVLVDARQRRATSTSTGSPRVSVPVLSKMTSVDFSRPLEREAVLDEQPVASTERRRDGDDERDGKPECVGAGDDEHGRGADEGTLRVASEPPPDEGGRARDERDVEQERRRTIGERLGARCRGLGRRDEAHDPRQRGLLRRRP